MQLMLGSFVFAMQLAAPAPKRAETASREGLKRKVKSGGLELWGLARGAAVFGAM